VLQQPLDITLPPSVSRPFRLENPLAATIPLMITEDFRLY
jgi:hypothetical protein